MRLQQYINEGRGKSIGVQETAKIIKKNCSAALKTYNKGYGIYRGITTYQSDGDFVLIDPKKHTRDSANTYNYYTLINDNSPKWKKYPKRSKSIVCTTDQSRAKEYGDGDVYVVFPFNGSKIGVCNADDYWVSFDYVNWAFGYVSLREFNDDLQKLFDIEYVNKYIGDIDGYWVGWSELNHAFRMFDEFIEIADQEYFDYHREEAEEDGVEYEEPEEDYSPTIEEIQDEYSIGFLSEYNKEDGLEKMFNHAFDPKRNKFELKKAGDKLYDGVELWTDGKSVYVLNDRIEEILELVNNR